VHHDFIGKIPFDAVGEVAMQHGANQIIAFPELPLGIRLEHLFKDLLALEFRDFVIDQR
jgi:hypothetical protein